MADSQSPAHPRESVPERLRAAPPTLWLLVALAVLTPPYVGAAVNGHQLASLAAWRGAGVAVLVAAGLLLRWRACWVIGFALDAYLLAAGVWDARADVAALLLAVKAALGLALLLSGGVRAHLWGSVEWREPADDPMLDTGT